jgi:rhamnogalacturonyl hydrolase YesR
MKKVETYQVTQGPLDPSGTDRWTEATLYLGVLAAYYVTKDPQYLTDATTWSSKNKYALLTTTAADYADNWTAGQVYTELYLLDPTANASDITASKAAVDAVTASPPTLLWYWCDALFMAPGLVVRLGAADATSGGATYYSFLDNEWTQTYTVLYDPTQKLFWRDATTKASTPTTYWSRGNGWVMAGTARVLEYLPQTDVQRSAYVTLLQNMASAEAPLQGSDGL